MIDAVTGAASLAAVQALSSTSTDSQIRALNAQIIKLRAQMDEAIKSKDDQETKTVKLNLIQQQITALEARIATLRTQQTSSSSTNTTSTKSTAQATSVHEYGIGANVDVYAFFAENEDDLR